jgi:hypothetical protein
LRSDGARCDGHVRPSQAIVGGGRWPDVVSALLGRGSIGDEIVIHIALNCQQENRLKTNNILTFCERETFTFEIAKLLGGGYVARVLHNNKLMRESAECATSDEARSLFADQMPQDVIRL